jgi:threonine dehydrogenase-like Zn-dependent dehydrogenase
LANHQIDVEPLIQARYTLDEGVTAFEHAARKGTLKVIVEM